MYSNVFDTVRNTDIDLINCEGLLYTSILNGLHPTFSLNQAVDSMALINIVQNDKTILNFIKNGYIKIALFGNYTGEHDELTVFLANKLSECIDKNKASFKFSSLPFLYTGTYKEKQLIELYSRMRDVVIGNKNTFTSYDAKKAGMDLNQDDFYKIQNYLETIRYIEGAIKGRYIPATGKKRKKATLYEKLQKEFTFFDSNLQESSMSLCIKDLKKVLEDENKKDGSEQRVNSRSFLYECIERLRCSDEEEKELKSIVDLCYNEVVAASINDCEDDIMVTDNNYKYAQIWTHAQDNNIDKAEQKLSLIRKSMSNSFSWEVLEDVLDNVPKSKDLEQWYTDMEAYCKSLKIEGIKLGAKRILKGTVPFAVAVLTDIGLEVLFQDTLRDIALSSVINHTIEGAEGVIASVSSLSVGRDLKEDALKVKKEYDTVSQLLVQTSLLKKDYGK